jgi:hypothetical protein
MKIKTQDLIGPALDWAVAECDGVRDCWAAEDPRDGFFIDYDRTQRYSPSTNWAQGGPIIEREGLSFFQLSDDRGWAAGLSDGPTPLVAAMRCYVRTEMGDEIEVPNELTKGE